MSRQKHAVKKNAWDGLLLIEKWRLAQYGDAAAGENDRSWREAANLINDLKEALFLEEGFDAVEAKGGWPGVNDAKTFQKIAAMRHCWAWNRILKVFSESLDSGNGDIFAAIAVIMERRKKPVDPAQTFIGAELQRRSERRTPCPTIQWMVDALKANSIRTSYNQVKRYFLYFGVTPSAGKPGRPKKPSQ
jgi:hypothetical protein